MWKVVSSCNYNRHIRTRNNMYMCVLNANITNYKTGNAM